MNWDLLFYIYTVFWVMIGWPVERGLKRVLKPAGVWGLGAVLLPLNLLIFLWQGNWFARDDPTPSGLVLRFVLCPTLILGLLSCYDGVSYYVSWFRKKRHRAHKNVSPRKEIKR